MFIMLNFVDELLVCCITEFLKVWEVWVWIFRMLMFILLSSSTTIDSKVKLAHLVVCRMF